MKKHNLLKILTLILLLITITSCNTVSREPYRIILLNEDGSTYQSILFTNFSGELPELIKDGYQFLGWFFEGELVDLDEIDLITPKSNLFLIANWDKVPSDPMTLTLIIGETQVEFTYIYNDDVPNWIINLEREGYVFEGWRHNNEEFIFGVNEIIDNMVIVAEFAQLYKVTFIDNKEVIKEVNVKENEYLEFEPRSSSDEHVFSGWYNGDEQFDFENTKVQSNLELQARYTDYHKVTYYDGEVLLFETLIEHNNYLEPYNLGYEKENYVFTGWTYLDELFDFLKVPVTSNMNLYARWEEDLVCLSAELIVKLRELVIEHYYPVENLVLVNAIIDEAIQLITTCESSEDMWAEYHRSVALLQMVPTYISMLTNHLESFNEDDYFEAEWLEIQQIYSDAINEIEQYLGGVPTVERIYNNSIDAINRVVTKEEDIENARYLKTTKVRQLENYVAGLKPYHYQALDWQLIQTLLIEGKTSINEAIGTVQVGLAYANALKGIQLVEVNERTHYTIFYFVDGEVYYYEEVIEGDCALFINAPEKEGYHFIGWYLADTAYNFETIVNASFNLVAKYEKDYVETFKVIFIVNGDEYESCDVEIGLIVKAPLVEPSLEGYEFVGWYLADVAYNFYTPVTSNLIIEAKFKEISSLPIVPDWPINEDDFEIDSENQLLAYHGSATEIIIPARVTRIFHHVFEGTSVEKVWFENGSQLHEVLHAAFANSNVTHVYFHNTQLFMIESIAFAQCFNLSEVYFPETLMEIGDDVFTECLNLQYINLEYTKITSLPNHLFMNNEAMTSIVIPPTVSIVRNSFAECRALTSITILSEIPPMMEGEFIEGAPNPSLVIYVPVGSLDDYVNAEGWRELVNRGIQFLEIGNIIE